jgi:hypothetical protein
MNALSRHKVVFVSGLGLACSMSMSRGLVSALGGVASSAASAIQQAIHSPPDPSRYVHTPEARLRQSIIIIRHGDRAPISERAGDNMIVDAERWRERLPSAAAAAVCDAAFPVAGPKEAVDVGKVPLGALTSTGAHQCFQVGANIRARLERFAPHLLPNASSHLAVRATNIRRTQVSVQNLLLGLLGRESLGRLNDAPPPPFTVPISVRQIEYETMLPNPSACPKLRRRWDTVRAQTSLAEVGTEDAVLLAAAKAILGYPEGEDFRLDQAREVLVCAVAHDDPRPAAMTDEMVLKLMRLNAKRWFVRFADPIVARLGMGLLVDEIETRLTAAATAASATAASSSTAASSTAASSTAASSASASVDDDEATRPPRCVLFSGHDSTLVPLLAALGLTEPHEWPQYAGSITIELADLAAAPGASLVRSVIEWGNVTDAECD